jgi:type II secretory ATPase GspE/PulE/Tfp pilus assembly ATPase PilB-like protein
MIPIVKEGTLGGILYKAQIITEKDVETALEEQKKTGLRFGEALVSLGIVRQEDINWALSHQLVIPYVRINKETVDQAAVNIVPASVARKFQFFPLIRVGDELRIAIADPLNKEVVAELERLTGCTVSISMGLLREIIEMQDYFYGSSDKKNIFSFSSPHFPPAVIDEINNDMTGAVLIDCLLRYLVEQGLSSLSLKPLRDIVTVTGRQGGALLTVGKLPNLHYDRLISTVREKFEIAGSYCVSAHGSLRFAVNGEDTLFQAILMRTGDSEYVTLKPFVNYSFPESIADLETSDSNKQTLRKFAAMSNGMVLFLSTDKYERLYLMDVCVQDSIRSGKETVLLGDGFLFSNARSPVIPFGEREKDLSLWVDAICEHEPDVIAVEEISNASDFTTTLNCVLKGNILFSGLPSPDIFSGLRQLCHLQEKLPALPPLLKGIAACRGVRILCPACREESNPDITRTSFPDKKIPPVFFKAKGCPACRNTGYAGKRYLVEAVAVDEEIKGVLSTAARIDEIMRYLLNKGFKSMAAEAADLLNDGNITFEEYTLISLNGGERLWQE